METSWKLKIFKILLKVFLPICRYCIHRVAERRRAEQFSRQSSQLSHLMKKGGASNDKKSN